MADPIQDLIQIKTEADAYSYILIYVAGYDGEITQEEVDTHVNILTEWMLHFQDDQDGDGDVDRDDLDIAVKRSVDTYCALGDKEALNVLANCVIFIKKAVDKQTQVAIVKRLRALTAADGIITAKEDGLVDKIEMLFQSDKV